MNFNDLVCNNVRLAAVSCHGIQQPSGSLPTPASTASTKPRASRATLDAQVSQQLSCVTVFPLDLHIILPFRQSNMACWKMNENQPFMVDKVIFRWKPPFGMRIFYCHL